MSDIPTSVRQEVHRRDGRRCRWCGRTNAGLEIHHVIYRSAGGQHDPEILITLCTRHHQLVHTRKDHYTPLLFELLELGPAVTGYALERRKERALKTERPNADPL